MWPNHIHETIKSLLYNPLGISPTWEKQGEWAHYRPIATYAELLFGEALPPDELGVLRSRLEPRLTRQLADMEHHLTELGIPWVRIDEDTLAVASAYASLLQSGEQAIRHENQPLRLPSFEELSATFERYKDHTIPELPNVPGVIRFKGEAPGPKLCITLHVHGNEPPGMAALWFLTEVLPLQQALKAGEVTFIIFNRAAAEKFYRTTDASQWPGCRSIEEDLNRITPTYLGIFDAYRYMLNVWRGKVPDEALPYTAAVQAVEWLRPQLPQNTYEKRRILEVLPVILAGGFDVNLDIHSVTKADSIPFCIMRDAPELQLALLNGSRPTYELPLGFPTNRLVTNYPDYMPGLSTLELFDAVGARSILLEAGQHYARYSLENAISFVVSMLESYGMIERQFALPQHPFTEMNVYTQIGNVVDLEGRLEVLAREHFSLIEPGEVIARAKWGEDVVAQRKCYSLFANSWREVKPGSYESVIILTDEERIALGQDRSRQTSMV